MGIEQHSWSPQETIEYVSGMLLELQKMARPHNPFLAYLIEVAYLESCPRTLPATDNAREVAR